MEKINYLDQYGGNNLTEKPLEYYLFLLCGQKTYTFVYFAQR